MESIDYNQVVDDLRMAYKQRKLFSYDARLKQLQAFYRMIKENEKQLEEALYKDLRKCKAESYITELMVLLRELGEAIKYLKDWMKPEKVKADLLNILETCCIFREPYGVVLIMGSWNYPVQLLLLPLVGALAAGNCAIIKPSELSPHTEACIASLVPKYLDPEFVRVITGGIPETTELLKVRFDKIFYTGSPMVGKIITKAASQYLTPVDLELGGKCPAIIDETCDFDTVANRIVWAKFCNSGQTCLTVDYILCIGGCQSRIVESMKKSIERFYGNDAQKSDSYGRIINKRHFQRVKKLIDPSKVVYGNHLDEDDLYISPTIMVDVTKEDLVMQEEIFGPILPIISVSNIPETIDFVQSNEKPLALYIFSNNKKVPDEIIKMTSSGSVCVNDAIMQGVVPTLPFGGVGNSGMGAYHGYFSYDTFSHRKSCLIKKQNMEFINALRYPPYDLEWKPVKYLLWLLIPNGKPKSFNVWALALFGVVVGFLYRFVFMK